MLDQANSNTAPEISQPCISIRSLPAHRSQFTFTQLPLEEVCAFRKSNTPPLWTEPDHWDHLAKHFGMLKDGKLVAVFRLNSVHEGKLPINEYFPEMPLSAKDVQYGRLMVATNERRGKTCAHLLHEFCGMLNQSIGRTFITPLDFADGGLSQRTFNKLGFKPIAAPVELPKGRTLKPMMRPEPEYYSPQTAI